MLFFFSTAGAEEGVCRELQYDRQQGVKTGMAPGDGDWNKCQQLKSPAGLGLDFIIYEMAVNCYIIIISLFW